MCFKKKVMYLDKQMFSLYIFLFPIVALALLPDFFRDGLHMAGAL